MKIVDYENQFQIADKFIMYNTSGECDLPLNYKMTSRTWADVISKWSGVDICTKAVIEVCEFYGIEKKEIGGGVFVFAMKLNK